MDDFWRQFDKNSFKWYNNVQCSINENVFYYQSCIIFIHECAREPNGELFYKPIPKCLWFKQLSEFEKYKQDCDGAYQMIAMVVLNNENYNLLNDDDKLLNSVKTRQEFYNIVSEYGIYLDNTHHLFRTFSSKYDHFSCSWFDDNSDSDSD